MAKKVPVLKVSLGNSKSEKATEKIPEKKSVFPLLKVGEGKLPPKNGKGSGKEDKIVLS